MSDPIDDEAEFARLQSIARSVSEIDRERHAPPPAIWDNIVADIDAGATVVPLWRHPRILQAAAVVALLAFGAVALLAVGQGDDDGDLIAEVALLNDFADAPLPVATDSTATVDLVQRDGRYVLDVDLDSLPSADGNSLEIWIIDDSVDGMFSLGTVEGDGTFELPAGVDPAGYPIVDISVEPLDGDPTHSGQSVLRGRLDL